MQKRTREILAVLLLGIFALAGVGAMGYYIFIGHNWNVAASHIDDSIGQMDGYTVVLFEGTRPAEDDKVKHAMGSEKSSSVHIEASQSSESAESAEPVEPAESIEPVDRPETTEQVESVESSNPTESSEPAEPAGPAGDSPSAGSSASATSTVSESSSAEQDRSDLANLDDVVKSYREKGANVFVVDAGDLPRYSEPFIVVKNGMRIGLFAVGKAELRSAARADAHYLSEHDVDYTIALTNDVSLANVAADGLIGNVSIIVCDDPKGEFPDGRYVGPTFCVCAPIVGEVGAVIISPSGVLSSKTIHGQQDL